MFDKILSLLGGNLFTGVAEIVGKFVTDPTKAAELHAELAKLEASTKIQLEGLAVQDRNSARQREMAVKDGTNRNLAYLIVAVFALAQYAVFTHQFPPDQAIMVSRVLGTIDMSLGLVLGYFFGSSAGQDNASRK